MATTSTSPPTRSGQGDPAHLIVPKAPALGRWLAVLSLGLLAGLGGSAGHWLLRGQQLDQAQAIGEGHAQTEALRRWASEAAQGKADPADLAQIQNQLTRRAEQLGSVGQPLAQAAQLSQAWPATDVARGQAAADALPQAFAAWRTADAAIARQSTLTSGAWGNRLEPVRTQLGALDPVTVGHIFDPHADRLTLQAQWAQSLAAYAKTTADLATQASQDATLPSPARQAVGEWADRWKAVADQATALSQTGNARVQAQGWAANVAPLALQASQATATARQGLNWPDYLEGAGLLLAVIGSVGLGLGFQAQAQARQAEALLGHRRRQALDDLESLSHQLQDLERHGGSQVQTDARSPARPLATAINRLLETRRALLDEIDRQQGVQGQHLDQLRLALREFRQLAQGEQNRVDEDGHKRLAQAQGLATLGQQTRRLQSQSGEVLNQVRLAHAAVQETNWRNEALRDGTQGQAKSLKRLSEGTQGIGVLMDNIHGLARRLSLQSMNAGLEAASLVGAQGRRLGLRTQEMETLATTTIQVTQEVIQMLRHIQDDTQSTLSAMEENTTNVVETGTRAARAAHALQGLEATVQTLHDATTRVLDGLEARAVDDAQAAHEAEAGQGVQAQIQTQLGQLEQTGSDLLQQGKAGFAALRDRLRALPGR